MSWTAWPTASQVLPVPAGPSGILSRVAGADGPALARHDRLEGGFPLAFLGEERALERSLLQRAVHVAGGEALAGLRLLVERLQRAPRPVDGVARALQRQMVAVHGGDHRETPLDMGEVLVVLANHEAGAFVVRKGQRGLMGAVRAGERRWGGVGRRETLR
jgi:hypothetical protein